ncbi:MAG: hypothetical protein OXF54_08570 [Caldilineaceae bacterium]|nr:hypothetical protein [Caldilineaceae bacterium]
MLEDSGRSEAGEILKATSEFLTEVFLISAYDIYYGHVPHPLDLERTPNLVVVDSGGYEILDGCDYSTVMVPRYDCEPWTLENLESVYNEWPRHIPAVFVSFDHPDVRKPFADQVADAEELFRTRCQHLTLLLLKPESSEQYTLDGTIDSVVEDAAQLGSFDIVGVTEKELGQTMSSRMLQITRLRLAMDDAGVRSPLHIFGALDPLSVSLYFIAGAEIFDGLTWLRYAYKDGVCIYRHNMGVLKYGLHMPDNHLECQIWRDNCNTLQSLQRRMCNFEATRNFGMLKPHAELLSNAYDFLKKEFGGRI